MQNILVITGGFPTASQTFVTREVASMLDRGFNVTVLASNSGDSMGMALFEELNCERCRVINLDFFKSHAPRITNVSKILSKFPFSHYGVKWTIQKLGYFSKLIDILEGTRLDLIHAHFLEWGFNVALPLSQLKKTPFTVTIHDSHLEKYNNDILKAVQQQSAAVALVSDSWKELWISKTQSDSKLQVVYNGVDAREFEPSVQSSTLPIKIIVVSRLTDRKRVSDALHALSQLVSKGAKVTLDILGDGPQSNDLRSLCEYLNLTDYVKFHGFCSHKKVRKMMSESHIFWHCSAYESFGIVIVEAMMCSLPVIVANSPGAVDVTSQATYGRLFESGDIDALIKNTLELVADTSRRTTEGKAVLDYSLAKFSWEIHINKMIRLWACCANSNNHFK